MSDAIRQAYGFIRGSVSRFTPVGQLKAMDAHGIPNIVQEGGKTLNVSHVRRETRATFLRMAKPGRLLAVQHTFLLADPKTKNKKGGRRKDLWDTIRQIEEKGAILWELATGRRTDDPRQRDGMIEDAIDALARGRPKYGERDKRGRPTKEWPDDVKAHNKPIWESRHHKTWGDAAKHFIGGMTAFDAWKEWGRRESDG